MVDFIQHALESIYGFRSPLQAKDYLLSTEAALKLGGTGRSDEELLLLESEDVLELGLYLSESLLSRVNGFEAEATARIWDEALPSFCELAEGVSHFLYVVHSKELDRQVSLLELEAQAEVDKFALCMLAKGNDGHWPTELLQRLFDDVSYRQTLTVEERHRYEEANRLARCYCSKLVNHLKRRRMDSLLKELRYSYRLGRDAKLRRFAGTA